MLEDLPHNPIEAHKEIVHKLNEHSLAIKNHSEQLLKIEELNRKQDEKLEKISKDTSTLVEVSRAGEGLLKLMKWIGKATVWLGYIASALYALYYSITNWPNNG